MKDPALSVLVVDDYEPSLYAQTRALRASGYRVLQARDGRTAIDLAVREHPDILLLDVHLPDLHGFEVCQQLKADARTAHIPVIHLSATGRGDRYRRESAAAGAFAYLQEPVPPGDLLRVMGQALDASKRLRTESTRLRQRATDLRGRSAPLAARSRKGRRTARRDGSDARKRPR
jgi:CheY-like chemotaxis protein